jgi:hypothetical protein
VRPANDVADTVPDVDAALALLEQATAGAEAADDEAEAIAALMPLFLDLGWLHALAVSATRSLSADPCHLFGLTAMTSGPLQQLIFASGPRASVTLGTLGRIDAPRAPSTHSFVGNHSLLRLLSADPLDGRLALLSHRTATCRDRAIRVVPDRLYAMDERRRVLWIAPPERQALFLRARVRSRPAPLVGTYRLGENRPHSLANGDDGLARSLALVEVLRVLGAPPPMEALRSLLPRAHGAQRWQIMREMLALDTADALPDLGGMAAHDGDPALRGAAQRILSRLSHPKAPEPCPA